MNYSRHHSKKVINWGILGCGAVVEEKIGPAFSQIANSRLYAVMRRNSGQAKASAEKLGAAKWYSDSKELINDKDVDVVYIATPPGSHYEYAMECAAAKKAAYIEKPFARSYKEALKIVEAFKINKTPLFVAHYRRALPRFIELKKILESGEIGEVREVCFRLTRKYLKLGEKSVPSWLYNPEESGGGKFFDIAPHSIDLLVFLFGEFEKLNSFAANSNAEHKVEDLVVMSFKTKFGVLGTANFNLLANEKKDEMLIYGTSGYVSLSVHGNLPIKIDGINGLRTLDIANPEYIEQPMVETIVGELLGKSKCPCTGKDALETTRIMDQALWDYYGGRGDEFWLRPDTWNKQ